MPDPLAFLSRSAMRVGAPRTLGALPQVPEGPSGIMALLNRPGLNEGLIAGGLALLGSDRKRETTGQALARAVPAAIATGRDAAQREAFDRLLESGPPEMRELMRVLGRERAALFMAERMMAGPPAPVAVGANERLVNPTDGSIVLDAMPQATDAARPVTLSEGADLVDPATGQVIASNAAEDTGPDFGDVAQLRTRFEQNIAPYEQSAQAFRKMEASATGDATPAKDIALVFNYMKAIDPSSSVREGEFATAQNAGSAFTVAGNLYNRVLTGQRLNDDQRAEFLNSAREQVASLLPQYQTVADQYRDIAESNRFDTAQVIRNPFAGLNLAPVTPANGDPLGIR